MKDINTTPTVSRRHGETIVELVYDAAAGKTALIVARDGNWTRCTEVTLESGEILVPYAANNNLIRHGCVLLASEPEACGSKEALLGDIAAYLHRYVDLSPAFERVAAHYVLLTWVFDAFNEIPYLRFQGSYGSGKTRALLALGSVAYKGFFASGASTVSPIFHTLDRFGGTLVLDEADLRFSDKTADLVKILNNGTVKGLPVLRTLQNRAKEFNPAAFTVFGPKIIAMRTGFRDEALESRFLTETMGQRPLRGDIPIELPETLRSEAQSLRNRLLQFRLTHLTTLQSRPERLIAGLDPRFNQTALALLSLADEPVLRDDIASLMRAHQSRLDAGRARHVESRVLAAAKTCCARGDGSAVPLRSIADRATEIGGTRNDPVSSRQAGLVLRAHGFRLHKSNGAIVARRPAFDGGLTSPSQSLETRALE